MENKKHYGVRNRNKLRMGYVTDTGNVANNFSNTDTVNIVLGNSEFPTKNIEAYGNNVENNKGFISLNPRVENFDCVLGDEVKIDFAHRKKQANILKKSKHVLDRLDGRKEVLTFKSDGNIVSEKDFSSNIQVNSIDNILIPDEIDEKYLAGKHLFIVDKNYSEDLYKYVKMILPYSYVNSFGDIHFFNSNGVDVILRGPFVLSENTVKDIGVDFVKIADKHIWVFDSPKVRDTFSGLEFHDFLKKDPYIVAFGFPPPEGVELEGLEVLVKLARKTKGKILSSDTGNFFDTTKLVTNFVWRVDKILPPTFVLDVLVDIFGTSYVDGVVSPPEVFETNFSARIVKDLNILAEKVGEKILYDLSVDSYDLKSFDYLLKRLFWKYSESFDSNSLIRSGLQNSVAVEWESQVLANLGADNNLVDPVLGVGNNSVMTDSVNNVLGKSVARRRSKDNWSKGYSFFTDFGFGSKIGISTVGDVDTDYRLIDGVSSSSKSALMFEYTFTWMPRDLSVLQKRLSSSYLREQRVGLLLLENIAMKLKNKYGGILLNDDSLPL